MSSRILLFALFLPLSGCDFLLALLDTDIDIDASCAGDDTVVIDGRDLCEEYERTGKVVCDVGYNITLDGNKLCD